MTNNKKGAPMKAISIFALFFLAMLSMQANAGVVKKAVVGVAAYEIKKHGPGMVAKYAAKKMADKKITQIVKDEAVDQAQDVGQDIAIDAMSRAINKQEVQNAGAY